MEKQFVFHGIRKPVRRICAGIRFGAYGVYLNSICIRTGLYWCHRDAQETPSCSTSVPHSLGSIRTGDGRAGLRLPDVFPTFGKLVTPFRLDGSGRGNLLSLRT